MLYMCKGNLKAIFAIAVKWSKSMYSNWAPTQFIRHWECNLNQYIRISWKWSECFYTKDTPIVIVDVWMTSKNLKPNPSLHMKWKWEIWGEILLPLRVVLYGRRVVHENKGPKSKPTSSLITPISSYILTR